MGLASEIVEPLEGDSKDEKVPKLQLQDFRWILEAPSGEFSNIIIQPVLSLQKDLTLIYIRI